MLVLLRSSPRETAAPSFTDVAARNRHLSFFRLLFERVREPAALRLRTS
jgi:hypothetical protein